MFQSQINEQPAPAVAGDFYGVNPRASVLGSAGMYSAPEGGLIVGRFVWVNPNTGEVAQRQIADSNFGFLRRGNNAVISEFLSPATFVVDRGLPITLFDQGDFWALFAAGATPGQLVYADAGTGEPIAGDAVPPVLDTYTAIAGAEFTIAVVANIATVTALIGYINGGTIVTSAGIAGVALGTRLTGTPGGEGTFNIVNADVAAEAGTGVNDVMTVSAVTTGTVNPGDNVDAPPADPGTQITEQINGTIGGIGQYRLNIAQYFTSQAVGSSAVLTPWLVNSLAEAGELAKISTWG